MQTDWVSIENYEETPLETDDFRFRCFALSNEDTPPHWHNHSEILYIRKGSCTIYINGASLDCCEGDIVFVPRGSLHSTLSQESYRYFALVIGDSLLLPELKDSHYSAALSPFLEDTPCDAVPIDTSLAGRSGMTGIIETIIDEYKGKKKGYRGMIKAELCRFFTLLKREVPAPERVDQQDRMTVKMKQVIQFISSHYRDKIHQAEMARDTGMSSQHFCRTFKNYTGQTFVSYLNDYRLEQADRLLKETDLPVTRIPELTGFCNVNYFSRLYRTKYGFSPSVSRKARQNHSLKAD